MSIRSPGVFSTLPENFFAPLSCPNRSHYAAMLVIYYRAFQESPHGVERKVLTARISEYIDAHYSELAAEQEDELGSTEVLESFADGVPSTEITSGTDVLESPGKKISSADADEESISAETGRYIAASFIRRLIQTGWISEEVLADYTRIINMAPYARPFLEALARIDEGLKVEYESHIVSVYSLLCGDAANENGHYIVLNAHAQTIALIDSLKILSQSIREHYEKLTETHDSQSIAQILAMHYDNYASDILDGAYKRLKTSDNMSRYRPRILAQVRTFLTDKNWLEASSVKYARTSSYTIAHAREKLTGMLEEISDTLKAVDPLLDEIDRRNMLYAKSSVERVKTMLEPPSTIAGRITQAALLIRDTPHLYTKLAHRLHRVRALTPESRYRRWLKETAQPQYTIQQETDPAELERAEAELRLRLARQLGPAKITKWLDEHGGTDKPLSAKDIADSTDGFIRMLYAVLYADSRKDLFPYYIEETDNFCRTDSGWLIPDIVFRRKR